MKRGEVTAFLSLIFVLIAALVTAILEAALLKSAGNIKRLTADVAIFSVFGEYRKELSERYDIFAVDISYGSGEFKEENITERLRYYGTDDMRHAITGIRYLTDENGLGFREQAVSYMENLYGLDIISGFFSQAGKWEELVLKGENADKDNEKAGSDYKEALSASQETDGEAEETGDPLAPLKEIKPAHILSEVLPSGFVISGKRTDKARQPSGRILRKGRGTFTERTDVYGQRSKLLFHEFLLKKFGNALKPSPAKEGALKYELEYMIGKNDSDAENLEAVAKKILMLRLGANMLFLEKDPARSGEAGAAALAACALLCVPEAAEAAKQLILFAWAYKESMCDLRSLFSGKKISLIKKEWEWQTTFPEVFSPAAAPLLNLPEGDSGYEDFLRILLFLKNEKELTMRALDCVEQQMRYVEKAGDFRADGAMIKLKVENTADIGRGITYTFPVSFMYI